MRVGILGAPRRIPSRMGPVLAAGLVIAFALPLFLVAGWPVAGWAVGRAALGRHPGFRPAARAAEAVGG